MSARKPVLPTLRWVVDNHTGMPGPSNDHHRRAVAEVKAAEAVIRAARRRGAASYWPEGQALRRALARLDALRGER